MDRRNDVRNRVVTERLSSLFTNVRHHVGTLDFGKKDMTASIEQFAVIVSQDYIVSP